MNEQVLSYLKSLKPKPHEDGRKLLQEGIKIGNSLEIGESRYFRESKYKTYLQYRKELKKQHKVAWVIVLGLPSLEEELEGIMKLYEHGQKEGIGCDQILPIPSWLTGLPKDLHEKGLPGNSYVLSDYDDYVLHTEAAPIPICFGDYHLSSPRALESTIFALKSGSPIIGELSQFKWDYTGFNNEYERMCDIVRALGVMASKYDNEVLVNTYLDDGFAGYFTDIVSYISYAVLEHYICTKLCGARYYVSYAGLLSDVDTRCASAMAIEKLLGTEDQPALHYLNNSTNLQWDHDIHGNYGISVPEMLFAILVEQKYGIGMGINVVAITEKISVPTLQELKDILAAGRRTEEQACQWLPYINFSKLEQMRDVMAEQGMRMFQSAMDGLKAADIDTEDPLEMMLVLKAFNPIKFEQAFHPSTYGNDGEIVPFYPTAMSKQTQELKNETITSIKEEFANSLAGKKIVLGSGDCHTYGLFFVDGVLSAMGAQIINGGVDLSPVDALDLADEENTKYIGISCHNGQAMEFGRQMIEIANKRNREYTIFIGGKLNAILPGQNEPTDISSDLERIGIMADNDIKNIIMRIASMS